MSTVKVKILRAVGSYMPGQEVEVSQEMADTLTREIKQNNGTDVITYRNAVTMKQHDAMMKAQKEVKNLSQGQAAEMGIKNVVQTPVDPKFESQMKEAAKAGPEDVSPVTPEVAQNPPKQPEEKKATPAPKATQGNNKKKGQSSQEAKAQA